MKYEEYLNLRSTLVDEASELIESGEDATEKMNAVEELDQKWDKQESQMANLAALNGQQRKVNVQNLGGVQIDAPVAAVVAPVAMAEDVEPFATKAYENAFAKTLMGKALTAEESEKYQMVNAAIETGTSTISVVVPETVSSRIWQEIEDAHPFINDITKTFVKGKITLIKEGTSSDATWYKESDATADGTETLATVDLAGCELSRAITISWKLKEMSIPDFMNYIIRKMAEKMGSALAAGALTGAGVVSGNASEPEGIVTKMPTAQTVTIAATSGVPTYAELASARAKIKSGYAPKIYANSDMIWNKLANVLDDNKRPIFILDATAGGVYRVFGCEVKEEAGMPNNAILFADASKAYHMNINKQITLTPEEHVKARTTDYCGYAIADGAIVGEKACSLLKK